MYSSANKFEFPFYKLLKYQQSKPFLLYSNIQYLSRHTYRYVLNSNCTGILAAKIPLKIRLFLCIDKIPYTT